MEKSTRKTELIYQDKSEIVSSSLKIKDLKSRAEVYFNITANKFFLSYKGMVFIHEDIVKERKMNKMEVAREKKKELSNAAFFEWYAQALTEDVDQPIKIKILNVRKKLHADKEVAKDSDSDEETKEVIHTHVEKIVPTAEDISRIGFVYLFRTIETFEFKIEEIKEMPTLLHCLSEQIKIDFKNAKGMFDNDGNLMFEPYNLNIVNTKGKLTPISKMNQIYEIVRSFPRRKKVYFNIKPYFDVNSKTDPKARKEKVIQSKEVVSEIKIRGGDKKGFDADSNVLSEQNFLDTLDDISKKRIIQVQTYWPGMKTDLEIYKMLRDCDGDVGKVCEQLFQ